MVVFPQTNNNDSVKEEKLRRDNLIAIPTIVELVLTLEFALATPAKLDSINSKEVASVVMFLHHSLYCVYDCIGFFTIVWTWAPRLGISFKHVQRMFVLTVDIVTW